MRSLRKRLEEVLARRGSAPAAKPGAAVVFGRLPRARKGTAKPAPAPDVRIEGRTVDVPPFGPALLLEHEEAAPEAPEGVETGGLLFFDIEATGLSCSPLFLVGVMTWEGGRLLVRQFLARDYSEEAAVVALFLEAAAGRTTLVSFNGRSYDLPYLRMRAAATGVPFALEREHRDLLHDARRAFGGNLPDCRLQTLETAVLGLPRGDGDIPGADIPDAYHAFVRTGDPSAMLRILRHNRRDLVTLARLLARLARPDP